MVCIRSLQVANGRNDSERTLQKTQSRQGSPPLLQRGGGGLVLVERFAPHPPFHKEPQASGRQYAYALRRDVCMSDEEQLAVALI